MKNFIAKYSIIPAFIVLTTLLELIGILLSDKAFYINDPRYYITIIGLLSTVLFLIKNDIARLITATVFISILGVINIFFILLFDMSGEYFAFEMFNLRGDAAGIVESIPLNFFFCFVFVTSLSLFYVFGKRSSNVILKMGFKDPLVLWKKVTLGVSIILICLVGNILTANSIQNNSDTDKYLNMLFNDTKGQYQEYGITSNFVNELYKGLLYSDVEQIPTSTVTDFLYDEIAPTSQYFGVSEGNNVLMVLCETFEWFSFIANEDVYPNGLKLEEYQLRELYPNLYKLLDSSVVLSNYYAKDKTDVSEIQSMLGAYPTDKFINYDYSENTIPHIIGNVLETVEGISYKNNFHNGTNTFYNRNLISSQLGFNHYYSSEELDSLFPGVFKDYILESERNLDSQLFEASKDLMFPEDERFFTYALTITMHGVFSKRNNLDSLGYYDRLREYGIDIDDSTLSSDEYGFVSYLATGLDFDASIGVIFEDLESKDLLEDTTIVFFSDHQAYYQGLTEYVKDISSYSYAMREGLNYMNTYNIPVMIYDEKLVTAIEENNDSRIVDKFTTSTDLPMTLYDILGVNVFENMYYGSSAFVDDVSLGYSRSYDVFYNDLIYFRNFNSILYYNQDVFTTEEELEEYIKYIEPFATKFVTKIKYTDQIFQFDIYGNEILLNDFKYRLLDINKKETVK